MQMHETQLTKHGLSSSWTSSHRTALQGLSMTHERKQIISKNKLKLKQMFHFCLIGTGPKFVFD
jgi:hypothetical protein